MPRFASIRLPLAEWLRINSSCFTLGRSAWPASSSCNWVMPMFIVNAAPTRLVRSMSVSFKSTASKWHNTALTRAWEAL